MEKKLLVLSSASALYSFMGHSYNYHSAVKNALDLDCIEYRVLIPKNNPISNKGGIWVAELDTSATLISKFNSKIVRFFYYVYDSIVISITWLRFYKKYSDRRKTIVFFETGGNFLDEALISLFLIFSIFKKPVAVWYLVRGLPSSRKFQYILRFSIFFAQFLAGKDRLFILTDTLPLKEALALFLRRQVSCVAIPHGLNTFFGSKNTIKEVSQDSIIRIWGVSCLGLNKGEDYLVSLLQNIKSEIAAQVLVRDAFIKKNDLYKNQAILPIGDDLSEVDFIASLQSCDVALLPYFGGNNQQYHLSSSGIFVDCLAAGLLPVVSPGTWMETELKRFGLEELIIEWGRYNNLEDLVALIRKLLGSENTIKKLNEMRADYCNFHSPVGFLDSMYKCGCLNKDQIECVE